MALAKVRNFQTTADAVKAIHDMGERLFKSNDIAALVPDTPSGTVSAAISQLVDSGLLMMVGVLYRHLSGAVPVYQCSIRWRHARNPVNMGLEAINRQARPRFKKGEQSRSNGDAQMDTAELG